MDDHTRILRVRGNDSNDDAHLSADFVIMQVHQRDDVIVVFTLAQSVWRVDEGSREVDAEVDVVAAAAPRPAIGLL